MHALHDFPARATRQVQAGLAVLLHVLDVQQPARAKEKALVSSIGDAEPRLLLPVESPLRT